MSDTTDRLQDVGRPHKRAVGTPAPATVAVLERYREAMRIELGELLEEIRPPASQLTLGGSEERIKPPLAERVKLWDLAIKIGRELDGAVELPWAGEPAPAPTSTSSRSSRAPRLSTRERRALGADR